MTGGRPRHFRGRWALCFRRRRSGATGRLSAFPFPSLNVRGREPWLPERPWVLCFCCCRGRASCSCRSWRCPQFHSSFTWNGTSFAAKPSETYQQPTRPALSEGSQASTPTLACISIHYPPYNAQFLTPWLSFLFLSFSQAARGEIFTGMRIEFSKGDRASSRMLKTTSRVVLGSPTSSTYPRGYASGVSLPAALRDAVLSILGLERATSR